TDEVTTIWSEEQRRAPIPKERGICFQWSDEARMHVTVPNPTLSKLELEKQSLSPIAEDLFCDHPSMRYTDLISTVKKRLTVSDRTAERKVDRLRHLGIIRKTVAGLYEPST